MLVLLEGSAVSLVASSCGVLFTKTSINGYVNIVSQFSLPCWWTTISIVSSSVLVQSNYVNTSYLRVVNLKFNLTYKTNNLKKVISNLPNITKQIVSIYN